jgi:hypothetical protein
MKKLAPFLLTAILVASIMLMIINIRVVEAGTITVPDDYSTIQEAINAARASKIMALSHLLLMQH